MGCEYFRDIDEVRREDEYFQRLYKVRNELEKITIGCFMASDLPSILRLQNFTEGGLHLGGPFYSDLEIVEERIQKITGGKI